MEKIHYCLDSELTVLGSIILDSDVLASVADILQPEQFYYQLHQNIFRMMCNMHTEGIPVDILTVIDYVVEHKVFDNHAEAKSYLINNLAKSVVNTKGIAYYACKIREKHEKARLCDASGDL